MLDINKEIFNNLLYYNNGKIYNNNNIIIKNT